MVEDEIGKEVVDCAVRIHWELGPGLLETVYETVLAHTFGRRVYRWTGKSPFRSTTKV
jgi:GxxExxY protein